MPALSWALSVSDLVSHDTNISTLASSAANVTGDGLQIICAWPVSGQYGAGSRVLYYILIAACVVARKAAWIKNACLAAALLLPAVAAVHAIVLAALHRDGAVDMDIYGCFQFCAIGILAAPVTVRLSQTYFNTPGRNTIFLWAGLILAGLLSLVVEFYRTHTTTCLGDDNGKPISSNPSNFPYDDQPSCGITCNVTAGPFSPMRGGAANNIYIIPAPEKLTFGAATLLAAACCVHAIVWMVSMLDKVLEFNWKSFPGIGTDEFQNDEPISGTNGATKGSMKSVNDTIRFFLSVAVVPIFGGAGLAILIIGERNFYSAPVIYQVEPLASIGQWSPIVGTVIAAIGSIYLVLAADVEAVKEGSGPDAVHHCTCSHHHWDPQSPRAQGGANSSPSNRDSHSVDGSELPESPEMMTLPAMRQITTGHSTVSSHMLDHIATGPSPSDDHSTAVSRYASGSGGHNRQLGADSGSRKKVAQFFITVGNTLGAKTQDWFDDSEFKSGKAVDFPEIPGENYRNPTLRQIKKQYNPQRDADGNVTPLSRSHSRAGSAVASRTDLEENDAFDRDESPRFPLSLSRSHSPFRQIHGATKPRSNTAPVRPSGLHGADGSTSTDERGRPLQRKATLEVPPPSHLNPLRIRFPESAGPEDLMSGGRTSFVLQNEAGDESSFPQQLETSPDNTFNKLQLSPHSNSSTP